MMPVCFGGFRAGRLKSLQQPPEVRLRGRLAGARLDGVDFASPAAGGRR
jgi:hypothetical protein